MKILFDHNVPKKLRLRLSDHLVRTAKEMDWAELENGDLLEAAEAVGFELMLTCDQSLSYQQNLSGRKLALVILSTNNWNLIKSCHEEITEAIGTATPGSFTYVKVQQR